ncbi:pentatricopeptide repeat-containing protein at3g09040 mitochondrial [Phtheirospermum japonicum]|uniref:Pentatricopeptide repeat-containing protein at3g09040 mitochondrial n=1 Tax=Phtheirospermum japonicum TaxID=374723 RepID=A0A830D0E5_9LAMI|nr:pentatricopeptide repeat-containing protein at3g09040 mitochondrial [Phtheirospermum japonicum]
MARLFSLQNPFLPKFRFRLLSLKFNHSLATNPHSTSHFLSLLPLCQKTQDLQALNSLLITHGLINHQPLLKHFINQCCHLGFPDLSLPAFTSISKPNLHTQNLILRSLSDNGSFENALLVHKKCRNAGVSSDNYTYPFVLKSCAALRDVWFGKMTHCVVLRTGFGYNLVVQTAVLDFYSKIGEMGNARKVSDEMPQPDLVAWNALISGYSVNGFDYEVLEVFHDMVVTGLKPNASTFASIFPVCSRVGVNVFIISSLNGLAYKLGCCGDDTLVPALISVYANCGDLLSSREIFDSSTGKNVAIWNAVISAYARNQDSENAAAIFKMMLTNEVKPNMVTFVSLIPSSENLGSILHVESLHSYVVKFGFEKEVSVVTALLSVYSKLGNINSAEFLFNNVRVKNILLWNSMVSAYAGHGFSERSLDVFRLMQSDGFSPDEISIISLLSSCSESKATILGKSAHAFSIKREIGLNLNVSNALLAFYCDCCELVYSFRIFDKMALKNIISWNTMISGCVDNGELEQAMLLFNQMRRKGVNFDPVTLISIIPSFQDGENPILGSTIHSFAIKTALSSDISLANALVSMYINCGELDKARLLFNDMPNKSVVSWNAILTGYRYCNLHEETIELFNEMIGDDRKPNNVTLLNVLPACYAVLQGKSVHAYIIRNTIPLETPLLTSLMIMYARFEILTPCMKLFRIGDKTSISLWNTVISAHLFLKMGFMAFSFFRKLLRTKPEPDFITVLNVVSACVQIKNLNVSDSILAYVTRKGFDSDVAIGNALIDMYAKCGSIYTAKSLFDVLPRKDTISWSIMINGYGLHGDGVAALSLYSRMRLLGFKPDKVTYMSVLSACSHAGYVEQGKMVFESMLRDDIMPGKEHYACMVDLLSRTGRLNEAYEIVKRFWPGKPCANILGSLLGGCLSHGDYRLGEEIGRFVLEMKPKDSTLYVVLHNIYASTGKWVEANNVRVVMEQNKLSKDPGISLVDANTFIH